MKLNSIFKISIIVILISFFSCEKKNERKVNVDSLSSRLVVLQDSIDKSWKEMIKADEDKINDIKIWISKIDKIKKQTPKSLDTLNELATKLSQVKYSQADISVKAVDKNDSISTEIMNRIIKIKESIPDLKKHIEEDAMFEKIKKTDNDVVTDRIKYQGFVLEYNSIVKQFGKDLKEKNEKLKDLKYKRGFQADSTEGI